MLESSLCNNSDAYILVKGTITAVGQRVNDVAIVAYRNSKQAILKNRAPFNDCVSTINNTQIDNVKDLDTVMAMYNLI